MSHRNHPSTVSILGFTIVELMIVIVVIGILSTAMLTVFNNTFNQYFSLQREGTNFTDLSAQTHRISNVLRGVSDISIATNDELIVYSYFSPNDQYVSKVRYYKNPTNTKLLADVTDMTANPPVGSPINGSLKTYTILSNYMQVQNVKLFEYLGSTGETLTTPITDLTTIKGIRVNLAVPTGNGNNDQSMNVQVSLRNRKTNL